jgi:tripartite-type tricarboxylate transporter receptor subunit TctC
VPTFAELGYKMVNDEVWYGLLAPAKTPEPIIKRLHEAAVKALAVPAVRDRIKQQGATPVGNTPEQFRAEINAQRDKMNDLVKKQGIVLEQ